MFFLSKVGVRVWVVSGCRGGSQVCLATMGEMLTPPEDGCSSERGYIFDFRTRCETLRATYCCPKSTYIHRVSIESVAVTFCVNRAFIAVHLQASSF